MAGQPVGLKYPSIPLVFDALGLPGTGLCGRRRQETFSKVQIMEHAALEELADSQPPSSE